MPNAKRKGKEAEKRPLYFPETLGLTRMILKFPDLATLRLALTSGAVPSAVSATPAATGHDSDGALWVESSETFSRATLNSLKKLGIQTARGGGEESTYSVACWAELLPLVPDLALPAVSDDTPVLFEIAGGESLAQVVSEMLRLGNDRQRFRWLEDASSESRALLRVVGPPYYSLLRAVGARGKEAAPAAFVERAPRVWIELGYTHTLAELIRPPDGKILLLRSLHRWTLLDDAPFRDIYEVLEFTLPATPAHWQDAPLKQRIRVAPTLKEGGTAEGAELWVLRETGVQELNRFIQNADDQLLNRLAFAVGEKQGETAVVVRLRQSRQAPPVLVLNAESYKQYLKLPNLFLPTGSRLHPPLRRDVVRTLLAGDPDRLTWLRMHPDGTFTPESLPEDVFRPLGDWVDYVLDHESQALQAWVGASQFDFERFICADDQPESPKKTSDTVRKGSSRNRASGPPDGPENPTNTRPAIEAHRGTVPAEEANPFADIVPIEPSEAQKRLKQLEEHFVAADGGLDNPKRAALWPELAILNSSAGGTDDASICWMNALWSEAVSAPSLARRWLHAEVSEAVTLRETRSPTEPSGEIRSTNPNTQGNQLTGEYLDTLLAQDEPAIPDLRALVASVVCAAGQNPAPAELVLRLNRVQRFLEAHERLLPVRGVWLAWSSLAKLAGNDALSLARARDRLLGRLFVDGLRPEQDLPTFLRFGGGSGGPRFQAVRQWLTGMCERARRWAARQGQELLLAPGKHPRTAEYIDLLFAFGLARLGETDASRRLLQRATVGLTDLDGVHTFLLEGFGYRIGQALGGKPPGGPLPSKLLEDLAGLSKSRQLNDPDLRYVADRMRTISRVLEPHQQIDPYRRVLARTDGDLAGELEALPDILDGKLLAERVRKLLSRPTKDGTRPPSRAQILRVALDQSPRVSEEFARELLDQVIPTYDALSDDVALTLARAGLLEKALFVAAHFDRVDHIPYIVSRFHSLLESPAVATSMEAIETLAGQCFRGLRKLGMRDEIDRLLALMSDAILQGKPLSSLDGRPDRPAALRALLHVAGGWFYFGHNARAEPVLKAARNVLFSGELVGMAGLVEQHTRLACAYAAALGQAPVEIAQRRLEEIFSKLTGVRDGFQSKDHYSQSQVRVVEAVVQAVVGEDFTMGPQVRRWLDEDEFLVRRRIHREMREMMTRG